MDHTLILVRHGSTAWNAEHRLQGQSEVPLSEAGRLQAQALAESLRSERVDRAMVSALGRARETAAAIVEIRPDLQFEVDPRLNELSHGSWEGRLEAELAADPAFIAWREDPLRNKPPGGESALDVARRVAPLLDALAYGPQGSRVLIVAHQMTNAVIQCLVSGIPLDQLWTAKSKPGELRRVILPFRA